MCVFLPSVIAALLLALFVYLGNPEPKSQGVAVTASLWKRYTANGHAVADRDRAIAYAERVVDRQINKLRGILSFDALILAFLSFERERIPRYASPWDLASLELLLLTVGILLLGLSGFLCLRAFRLEWGRVENYGCFQKEFGQIVEIVAKRSAEVARAVWLTIIALTCAMACFVSVELLSAPTSPCGPSCRMEDAVNTVTRKQ